MATYEEIYGKRVKDFDSDPTLESSYEGQVWYDKSTGVLKSVVSFQAWSSSSPLATARKSLAGFGTQTAAVAVGGDEPPFSNKTEEYNGTGWTSSTNYPLSIYHNVGCGTETAGLVCGGNKTPGPAYTDVTNEYNGSSWTSGGSLAQGPLGIHAVFGTQTAAVQASGYGRPPNPAANTSTAEEYNGTSWTATNAVNTARRAHSGGGVQTAGIISGGFDGSNRLANSEEYNGTSFSEGNDINTARTGYTQSGGTTESNSWICGGTATPGKSNATEYYDGTSWTTQPATLAAARSSGGAGGIQNTAVVFGGENPSITSDTEELNFSVNTVTAAAWAAGGSISTVRTNVGSTSEGSQTAAMVWGGRTGPPPSGPYTSNKSDTYDGTSFTVAPNLNTAARNRSGGGTTTAAWCTGGQTPPKLNATEEYDGSSWTSVTNAPIVLVGSGTGVQTAGLIAGIVSQSPPTGSDAFPGGSLEYDGTNWAAGGSPSADRHGGGCSGTQTAGTLISGQSAPYGSRVTTIEEYDGSSWTSGGSAVIGVTEIEAGARGPQTATLITGGNVNPPAAGITTCSNYDGTATATTASMGSGRRGHGSDGGQTSGLVMTGQSAGPPVNNNPNYTANAEELTAETTAVTASTLTTS